MISNETSPTNAGFNAAGVDPNSVSFAGLAAKRRWRIGPRTIPPSYADVTRTTAAAPLGPAAPATVHWETQKKERKSV